MARRDKEQGSGASGEMEMPVIGAVLLAAGQSTRFGGERPKQFATLGGRPVFTYSLDLLSHLGTLRALAVVLPTDGAPRDVERTLDGFEGGASGVRVVRVAGGARRQDSVAAGLAALEELMSASGQEDLAGTAGRGSEEKKAGGGEGGNEAAHSEAGMKPEVILVHDAARPFAPRDAVARLAVEARGAGGAILAARVSDTVKLADERGMVERTLERDRIWLAQTPQAFQAEHLARVAALLRSEREFTDEAAALEALGVDVALVESPATNFKITRAEDLERAESLLMQGGI